MLEIDSLGYQWKGEELEANATYSCLYCHQRWIKLDDELIKCVSVTEVGDRKPYQRKKVTDCEYCHNTGGMFVPGRILRKRTLIWKRCIFCREPEAPQFGQQTLG